MDATVKKVAAATLGCKVNMYETQAMLELFRQKGYEIAEFGEYADIYLINTCTVTNTSDKKSRQLARRARALNSGGVVVVCGCYAQVYPREAMELDGVDLAVGTRGRSGIVEAVEAYLAGAERKNIPDIMKATEYEKLRISGAGERTRAYVKIQDGCENFCTYCIIPYARGPVRSRAPADVLDEVKALAANGFKEIVLTGIHAASYGNDLGYENLVGLIYKVHEISGVERIRLSSIEPGAADGEFVNAVKSLPKLCPHFHLSLQSGCDATLARMNRRYTAAEYRAAAERLRAAAPACALTTDVIAGFPGESEEDFAESLEFVRSMAFARIHVFPYSAKKGTPAAAFPQQLSRRVKEARAERLLELGKQMEREFIGSFLGSERKVLFESKDAEGRYTGHTDNYIEVRARSGEDVINRIMTVKMGRPAEIKQKFIAYCVIMY